MKIQDIQLSDKTLWQDFVAKYEAENYYGALEVLQNSQLASKANTASISNAMIKAINDLQDLYYNNVEDKLAENLAKFQGAVDSIVYQGEYEATKQYAQGNFVLYNGDVYMYTANTPSIGNLPTNTAYWYNLGLKGAEGAPSLGLNLRYNWQSNLQYNPKDVVYYGDSMYWAKQTSTGEVPSYTTDRWFKVVYKDGVYISQGYYKHKAVNARSVFARSIDGLNWTPLTISGLNETRDWLLAANKSRFIIIHNKGKDVFYSTDGVEWTAATTNIPASTILPQDGSANFKIVEGIDDGSETGVFFGLSPGGYNSAKSVDGVNWETFTYPLYDIGTPAIAYGNGIYVTLCSYGFRKNVGWYSTDGGLTWTNTPNLDLTAGSYWNNLAFYQGNFIAFGTNQAAAYSTDGANWTLISYSGYTPLLDSIIEYNSRLMILGQNDNSGVISLLTSQDGITWNSQGVPNTTLDKIEAAGQRLFGFYPNYFGYSIDGLSWTEMTMYINLYWGILIQNLPADITVSQSTPTKPYKGQLWWQID